MEEQLMNYGLSEKEAKLYLLCLKTGETTANRLIDLSGFPRATVYDILDKLIGKGLVTSIVKKGARHFRANDPEVLVKNLEEKKTEIKPLIPKLKKIQGKISKKVEVEIFEGLGGVKKVLDDILENCKIVYMLGNEKYAREITLHHSENFRLKRIKKKIKIRLLVEDSDVAQSMKNNKYSKVRHIKELENSKDFLMLYNNKVIHLIPGEPVVTIRITSKEYFNSQKIIFDKLWEKES